MGKIMISECKFLLEDEKERRGKMNWAIFMWLGYSVFEAIEKYMDMEEQKYIGPPDYLYDLVQDHPGVCPGYCPNPAFKEVKRIKAIKEKKLLFLGESRIFET